MRFFLHFMFRLIVFRRFSMNVHSALHQRQVGRIRKLKVILLTFQGSGRKEGSNDHYGHYHFLLKVIFTLRFLCYAALVGKFA